MPTRSVSTQSSKTVPIEFSGKWVAWNSDHSRIVAHAKSLQELWELVREQDIEDPVFEKVPRAELSLRGY